jgi:Iap family predicted aminopeptidase
MKYLTCALVLLLLPAVSFSQGMPEWDPMIGAAFTDNDSYRFLQRLCDEAGGRLTGSPGNEKALTILREELGRHGIESRLERYSFSGFERGEDEVTMLAPINKRLRAVALGNVDRTPTIEAPLVYASQGAEEDYTGIAAKGSVILVTSEAMPERPELLRSEAIGIAARHGATAILFINERPGGITTAGMSNFHGQPSPIPAYSLTLEEGKWLQRLAAAGKEVRMRIVTDSRVREVKTANAVVTLPGKVEAKLVVGAHFDSWDVNQGAVDNGIGSAILFDVARLLKRFSPDNYYTVEFVWFNGEELGLWGSRKYIEMHAGDSIVAMVNMDMTGSPRGFTAMGFDPAVPLLKDIATKLNGFDLSTTIGNSPWTNSDHQPFMLHGIPTISPTAHLDKEMVSHYHDLGDSFDKVSRKYLAEAAAVVSVLVRELANDRSIAWKRRSDSENIEFFKKHKLEDRLRKQKEWPWP